MIFLLFLSSLFPFLFAQEVINAGCVENCQEGYERAIPPGAFPPPFDSVPWIQDRMDFCVCFKSPVFELLGFNDSCIAFVNDYTWLWEHAYQYFPNSCLGACPCGPLTADQCLDDYNCAPLACDGAIRLFYSGSNATLGVGTCQAGSEQCVNGTKIITPEVLPQPENCTDQVSDFDCDGFPGCLDMDCSAEPTCQNDTVEYCFDQLATPCNDSICIGVSRQCYTGPNGTLSVGMCSGGTETCLANLTSSGCTGETLPSAEVCSDQVGDHDCNGFAGCFDSVCKNDTYCIDLCFATNCTNSPLCDDISRLCYTGPNGTVNVGTCSYGAEFCLLGTYTGCLGEVTPAPVESCNPAEDITCDGDPLDGFPLLGTYCDNGLLGACFANGTYQCNGFTNATECNAPIIAPVAEVCSDPVGDFDCDGFAGCDDSDCFLAPECINQTIAECFDVLGCNASYCIGLTRSCYTGPNGTLDVGICSAGFVECLNGTSGGYVSACQNETLPMNETCGYLGTDWNCDGIDNNVDPATLIVDFANCGTCGNDCSSVPSSFACCGGACQNGSSVCEAGIGACAANGTLVCNSNGTALECNAVPGSPVPETCDNLGEDSNCDGIVDNILWSYFAFNNDHCGACGNNCSVLAGSTCNNGTCECPTNTTDCGGVCTSILTEENCGACGNNCNNTLLGTYCDYNLGSPFCLCPLGTLACSLYCADPLTDSDNCGACNVTVDDFNECTYDYCSGGSIVNDGAILNGMPCGGGNGTCYFGNCTDATIKLFAKSSMEYLNSSNPTLVFTITVDFTLQENENGSVYDTAFGWENYYSPDGGNIGIQALFVPKSTVVTGDCVGEPAWGNISSYNYADMIYPYISTGYTYWFYTYDGMPIAYLNSNMSGTCYITIYAEWGIGDEVKQDVYDAETGIGPTCYPSGLYGGTNPNWAFITINGVVTTITEADYTACPLDAPWSVSVRQGPPGPFTIDLTFDYIYFMMIDKVVMTLQSRPEFNYGLASCTTVTQTNSSCFQASPFPFDWRLKYTEVRLALGVANPCRVVQRCVLNFSPPTVTNVIMTTALLTDNMEEIANADQLNQFDIGLFYEYSQTNYFTYDSGLVTLTDYENCADLVQNQDETDVDCGGSVCIPCASSLSCVVDEDCISRSCVLGTCA